MIYDTPASASLRLGITPFVQHHVALDSSPLVIQVRIKYFERFSLFPRFLAEAAFAREVTFLEPIEVRSMEKETHATRSLYVDRSYLIMPVHFGASLVLMRISEAGARKRKFGIKLANADPDYFVSACLKEFMGKTIEIECEGESDGCLDSLMLSDEPVQPDDLYSERYRQQYHFSAARGFINDPNGLVYYAGEYHLYYQHQPFGTDIGFDLKHWGHAVSRDLLHWTELDTAIYPDKFGGIYSGSTVVDWDNSSGLQTGSEPPLVAMYTVDGRNGDEKLPAVQCIASSNDRGRTWQKYKENPVLDHIVGLNRDPRVFRHEPSNEWRMVMYLDDRETYAIFGSTDLKKWVKLSAIILPDSQDCPDLFELAVNGNPQETKWVLFVATTHYLVGSFDGTTFTPETEPVQHQPVGRAYAAQTWSDMPADDSRVVQISWFLTETPGMPFTNCMTVPCALSLTATPKGLRLCTNPVRELENLRKNRKSWTNLILDSEKHPKFDPRMQDSLIRYGDWVRYALGKTGDSVDIECDIVISSAKIAGISIRGIEISYHRKSSTLSFRRGPFDPRQTGVPMEPKAGVISLRILLDRVSIEVFSSDGQVSLPAAMLPVDDNHDLFVMAKGGSAVVRKLDCWQMKSIHTINQETGVIL